MVLFCFQYPGLESQEFTLEVRVEGYQTGKGILRVCLFDSEDSFFNHAMVCEVQDTPINMKSISLKFSEYLPAGKYAIAVYQDINKNGVLDRNWLGVPTEPYGFSNNPSTLFGPPSFQKAAFELTGNHIITIKL